jgi:HlyD family secretion protein
VRQARAGLLNAAPGDRVRGLVTLRAPVDSNVLRIPDRSERVVAAGSTLLILGDLKQIEVLIELLSTEAVKVRPGMPVLLDGWGGGSTLKARVARVEPYAFTKVSALGIEEKRVNVLATLEDRPPQLGDGYRLTAHIVTSQIDSALRLPSGAVFRCELSWCSYVLSEGRARRRQLETAARNADYVEVRSGLQAGEQVIIYPANDITDGARVRARAAR